MSALALGSCVLRTHEADVWVATCVGLFNTVVVGLAFVTKPMVV
jgi:hypothetical protein